MGGAVMHNLALALQENGHQVTGSDDEIYSPAKERLEKAGLLPIEFGWFPEKITPDLDLVILGMHARADNPELKAAMDHDLKVLSFPAFIFQHALEKTRVVVAGSHGKTTTTAIIMHVLRNCGVDFDYLVGAQLEGFETMVRLSAAPIMVIEGDEYLSSAIDPRPKFLHYQPHLAVITGVAWDHINVFPSFESYKDQFAQLLENLAPAAEVVYYGKDADLRALVNASKAAFTAQPYQEPPHKIAFGKITVRCGWGEPNVKLKVFGGHNLANMAAAHLICLKLGISSQRFWKHAATFKGAAKRLQLLAAKKTHKAWLDFAHAPSKVKATVEATKSLYPNRPLVACLELHTFSSLNKDFLPLYAGTLGPADSACVYFSPHTLAMKKLPALTPAEVKEAFGDPDLRVFTESAEVTAFLKGQEWYGKNLLLMSSGNFGGLDLKALVKQLPE